MIAGIFLQLFYTFFVIGFLTFGGGFAMISLIEHQVVFVHSWLTETAFTDIVAISQMTPGPIGINTATYVGYSVLHAAGASDFVSVLGSFVSTTAIMVPSFVIMVILVKLYERLKKSSIFADTMSGIRPVSVGLLGSAAILLATPANFIDWKSFVIFFAALAVSMWTKLSPILTLCLAGLTGFLIY